jgi:hypothetical protein
MKINDVLLEFAPGRGGESGRWYTDDQMTDIVGDGWWQDLDISEAVSKQGMIQEAQAWLDDQGYSVQVLNVKVNDDDCDWFIQGSFDNPGFANEGMAEDAEPMDREFALVKKLGRLGERIVQNPKLWDRYDQAIDNEDIDWIIGLIQDGTGATASEVTKLADLFGEIGGGLGRLTDFAWAVKEGTWEEDFMNPYRAHRSQGLAEGPDDSDDYYSLPRPYGDREEEFPMAQDTGFDVDDEYNDDENVAESIPAPAAPAATTQQPATTPAATAPAAPAKPAVDPAQQQLLDRMGKRFGLPPGSSMEQVAAAQQAYLNKNDPAAAAQNKQNMANIDAGNTAANKPVQLAPKAAPAAPAQDKNFAAGLAAQKAGGSPTEIMLAQPGIANNQKLVDQVATTLGLPAGTPVEQVRAAAAKRAASATPTATGAGSAQQKAIDDMSAKQGFPAGLTKDQFYKMYQDKLNKQQAAMMPKPQTPPGVFGQFGKPPVAPAQAPTAAPVAEANKEKEADYGPDYQDMVARVKKLAGLGPLKTVYDPQKRVYKNVPVAVQPKK